MINYKNVFSMESDEEIYTIDYLKDNLTKLRTNTNYKLVSLREILEVNPGFASVYLKDFNWFYDYTKTLKDEPINKDQRTKLGEENLKSKYYYCMVDENVDLSDPNLRAYGYVEYFLFNKNMYRINEMFVIKEATHKGIGSLMLSYIQNRAVENRIKYLSISTNSRNIAAQKCYEKFGFKGD